MAHVHSPKENGPPRGDGKLKQAKVSPKFGDVDIKAEENFGWDVFEKSISMRQQIPQTVPEVTTNCHVLNAENGQCHEDHHRVQKGQKE